MYKGGDRSAKQQVWEDWQFNVGTVLVVFIEREISLIVDANLHLCSSSQYIQRCLLTKYKRTTANIPRDKVATDRFK